jgi:Kef-type K+ transport system membrane component KefB
MDVRIESSRALMFFGSIMIAAELGKYSAAALAAKLSGLGWSDARTLATLLMTKGAVDLILISILQRAHLLPDTAVVVILVLIVSSMIGVKIILRTRNVHMAPARNEEQQRMMESIERPAL